MLEFIKILSELKEVMWTLVGILGIGFITLFLVRVSLNEEKYGKFNLIDAFATNGVFSGSKSRLNLAFIVSSWIVIWVAMRITTLTSDFVLLFTSYGSFWIVDRMDSRKKNVLPTPGGESKIEESKDT